VARLLELVAEGNEDGAALPPDTATSRPASGTSPTIPSPARSTYWASSDQRDYKITALCNGPGFLTDRRRAEVR
jgi:hypothetical protein